MEKQELFLDTTPDSNNIWKEIGGNYENVQQSINELVDNSISNIIFNRLWQLQIHLMIIGLFIKEVRKIELINKS